jgi:hypothetical protein
LVVRENSDAKLLVKLPLIMMDGWIVWRWDVSVGEECISFGFMSSVISGVESFVPVAKEWIPLKISFNLCLAFGLSK